MNTVSEMTAEVVRDLGATPYMTLAATTMNTVFEMTAEVVRDPGSTLHMTLAATYVCTTAAYRCHIHPPWQLYALSAAVYGAFALLHVAAGH